MFRHDRALYLDIGFAEMMTLRMKFESKSMQENPNNCSLCFVDMNI